MINKKQKLTLRIITAILLVLPGSLFTLLALVYSYDSLKTANYLNEPFLFLYFVGGILGFVGLCLCAFNQYNYITLTLLALGTISIFPLIFNIVSSTEGLLIFMFILALLIPNGILCFEKKTSNENAARDASHP